MERTTGKHAQGPIPITDADGLLRELTVRQHLTPHRPLGQVVAEIVERVGACPVAADGAMTWLDLQPDRSIGRLKRGELSQLARSMHRLWSQALAANAAASDPAAPMAQPETQGA